MLLFHPAIIYESVKKHKLNEQFKIILNITLKKIDLNKNIYSWPNLTMTNYFLEYFFLCHQLNVHSSI